MSERFSNLTKIPDVPAAKMLADANIRLKTPLDAPASAKASVVLAELDAKDAWVDMLILLGVILPGRERVWWACLAARDYIGPKSDADPLPLTVAETWVFKPNEDNRDPLREAMDHALPDDDTVHCARAALFADGTLGTGDAKEHPAPPGAAALSAYAMNMVALGKLSDKFEQHKTVLIDRALDIARGGNGRIAPKAKEA
ncbi:DUF6931 family protein [Seohaeicola zhoushanensis]|uniref:Uncharacterized protein n=1 Tax=Seohaeicola zhoushanensis TaxID=1569283 RepID=A0A8J3M4I2_9RHOB|nr:hypothetical protein [Seohaeicola zhoushanensis]GHF34970.1 hypothetical protein GCM10017056_03060 [Seohaeicola zhoushanensis]